ncbi:hypothetical protein SK128_015331 [Halocaridina rubra]|uniref:Uncharacterized protein n=1 Tax=Halocaridina rubra TaxID=373956 RepID=A0AAN8X2H3_HALRR
MLYQNRQQDLREAPPTPSEPIQDFPPDYRLTWRKEFIEKSPQHLKMYLEEDPQQTTSTTQDPQQTTSTTQDPQQTASTTQDPQQTTATAQVRTLDLEPGVHSGVSLQSGASNTLITGRELMSSPGRTVPQVDIDEGLPTYEEAQNM